MFIGQRIHSKKLGKKHETWKRKNNVSPKLIKYQKRNINYKMEPRRNFEAENYSNYNKKKKGTSVAQEWFQQAEEKSVKEDIRNYWLWGKGKRYETEQSLRNLVGHHQADHRDIRRIARKEEKRKGTQRVFEEVKNPPKWDEFHESTNSKPSINSR